MENFILSKLELRNFTSFKNFECEFSDKITRLVGVNGSGKTTVGLKSIWAVFHGIASRGKGIIADRFQFIGNNGRSADINLTIKDIEKNIEITLKRHITNNSTTLEFVAPEGYDLDEKWFKNLLNVSFLSAKHFTDLSSKEQAKCLGIDTSDFDQQIKEQKENSRLIRKELNNLGTPEIVEKTTHESITELLAKRDDLLKFNNEQADLSKKIESAAKHIEALNERRDKLMKELDEVNTRLIAGNNFLKEIKSPQELKDVSVIDNKIKNIEQNNIKATLYSEYIKRCEEKENKELELLQSTNLEKTLLSNKNEYVSNFDLGFDNLSIDENGGLLLNNRPINEEHYSRGQLEIIIAELYASINPSFKVRFIDEFSVLDRKNQKKIVDDLLAKGFQVIIAEVGEIKVNSNTILLRDCQAVESYPSDNNLEI